MSEGGRLRGRILVAQSGLFEVETEAGIFTAQPRGRLKAERGESDLLAVGDWVSLRQLDDGSAVIDNVEPRQRMLSRETPSGGREQVLISNLDQAVFVFACQDPPLNRRMLDRMIVAAEREQIPVRIVVNKVDLDGDGQCRAHLSAYRAIDYPLHFTSAVTGEGVDQLRQALVDRVSVLAGPSGVGKTSLLNAIQPELGLRTSEIRQATRKGSHTTVAPKLIPLEGGGYIADTPGVKAFALWDIEPDELDAYFREIAARVPDCAFSDCSHEHEPDCAVRQAVEAGEIDPGRYDSYLRMRNGEAG